MNRPLRRLVLSFCLSAASTAVCADQTDSPFPTSSGLWGATVPAGPAEGNNLVGYGGVPVGAPVIRWHNQGYSGSYQRSAYSPAGGSNIAGELAVRAVMVPAVAGLAYAAPAVFVGLFAVGTVGIVKTIVDTNSRHAPRTVARPSLPQQAAQLDDSPFPPSGRFDIPFPGK